MANPQKNDILLEVGTNELMIMEFSIDGKSFGINVSKVLEILQYEPVTSIPHSNQYIEGVFKPRDQIITAVNLPLYLGLNPSPEGSKDIMIITNFNSSNTAFHVHNVDMIHRMSWKSMEKPDDSIYKDKDNLTVGIVRLGEKLITILDFEKIMSDIVTGHQVDPSELSGKTFPQNHNPIYIVEDSLFLIGLLKEYLNKSGYDNLTIFSNGQETWDALLEMKADGPLITDKISCLITDIEMPLMDGHALTKKIKSDPVLKDLPIIIFSSLINDTMKEKGDSVGADGQVAKPDIKNLVHVIKKYTTQQKSDF